MILTVILKMMVINWVTVTLMVTEMVTDLVILTVT